MWRRRFAHKKVGLSLYNEFLKYANSKGIEHIILNTPAVAHISRRFYEKDGFKIVFWEKLPYVTPIAVQTPITLYKDIEGTVINDIYNPDPNLHMQTMYMCVFPIEHETVVGVFYHKKDRNYRSFLHQMNCMSASNKLQYINYLIFANTENYYFSKTIEDIVRDNEKLKLLGQENNGEPHLGMLRPLEQLLEYKRIKPDEIPNFLMPEYKINS